MISKGRKLPAVFEYSELFLQLHTWYKYLDSLDIVKNLQLIHSNRLNQELSSEPSFPAPKPYLLRHTLISLYFWGLLTDYIHMACIVPAQHTVCMLTRLVGSRDMSFSFQFLTILFGVNIPAVCDLCQCAILSWYLWSQQTYLWLAMCLIFTGCKLLFCDKL